MKEEVVAAAVEAKPVVEDSTLHKITSPMVGTFYQSSSPDAACLCTSGEQN